MGITFQYDRDADALYVHLRSGKVHRTQELEDGIVVDRDLWLQPIGFEILAASRGFNTQALRAAAVIDDHTADLIDGLGRTFWVGPGVGKGSPTAFALGGGSGAPSVSVGSGAGGGGGTLVSR